MKLLKDDGRFVRGSHSKGRGVPLDGMVLVYTHNDKESPCDMMVSEEEWRARLDKKCIHNLRGWACKTCIQMDKE